MSSTINAIHTPCKDCVFAEYSGETQIGCHLKYLDKYRDNNVEILEVYDDHKEFYVINNKKCVGYRDNSWFEKRQLSHLSLTDKISKFMENNFLHYLLVVDMKNFSNDDINQLTNELAQLKISPRKIIFIRYSSNKNYPYEMVQDILKNANLKCKWRLQTMLEDDEYDKILYETMNLNKKYRFVMSIDKRPTDLDKIVSLANKIVYDDLGIFLAIRNKEKSAILFSAPNFRQLLFSDNKDLLISDEYHTFV